MFIVGLLGWWYGAGWRLYIRRVGDRLMATADFFSIDLLLATLFSPFKQISAGHVRGSLEVQFRAFIDQLISRLIGAMVRSFLILMGSVSLVLTLLLGGIGLVLWLCMPLLPIIGVVLTAGRWLPW